MHRYLLGALLLGGLVCVLTAESRAQSMKKLGGPTIEIDGLKSQAYEHWKSEKVDKPVLFKFTMIKTKDMPKDLEDGELLIMPVADGAKALEELKTSWDGKATTRTQELTGSKLKGTMFFGSGTFLKKPKPDSSITEAKKMPKWRVVAWTVKSGKDDVLIQLSGPVDVVGLHRPDVEAWLKNFK
jgi:hypothetical protein